MLILLFTMMDDSHARLAVLRGGEDGKWDSWGIWSGV